MTASILKPHSFKPFDVFGSFHKYAFLMLIYWHNIPLTIDAGPATLSGMCNTLSIHNLAVNPELRTLIRRRIPLYNFRADTPQAAHFLAKCNNDFCMHNPNWTLSLPQ